MFQKVFQIIIEALSIYKLPHKWLIVVTNLVAEFCFRLISKLEIIRINIREGIADTFYNPIAVESI